MKKIILSDNKQNQLVDEITDALMQRHEFRDGVISGAGIAGFCPHQQVNSFILFRIYQDWNAHMQNFVHPYFDFNHPDVREGLRRFQNTVSRHIRIAEADFRKLVRSAVYNSLKLVLNPEETIVNFFFSNAQAIPAEIYAKHAPYFSDFDFAIKSILRYLEKNEMSKVERTLFLEKFGKVIELFEKKEGKSIGQYQRFLFRRLTGKEMDEVVGHGAAPAVPGEDPRQEEEERQKAEEAHQVAEAEKREEMRMAAELRREEEARKAAEEARRKAEAQKEEETRKAEETKREEEEARNRPVIKVTPKPRPEPENRPAPEEKKPTVPPWVDKPKEEEKKEEPEPPKPEAPEEPSTTIPPWVERNQRNREPNPGIKVVSSPPGDETTGPPPAEKEKPADEEGPRTISDALRDKQKEERPRSLNEMYSNRDQKPSTLLDQSREKKESQPEKRVADLGTNRNPATETPREQPVAEEKSQPVAEEQKLSEPRFEPQPREEEPRQEPKKKPEEKPAEEPENKTPVSLFTNREEESPAQDKPRTLADSFQEKHDEQGSVNQRLSGKSIKTEQIPVHKQFQFVQRVFGGSSVKFKVVLDKINKTETLEEVVQVLDKYVYNDPNVNRNDKVAKEFEQLVRARFE